MIRMDKSIRQIWVNLIKSYLQFGGGSRVISANSFCILQMEIIKYHKNQNNLVNQEICYIIILKFEQCSFIASKICIQNVNFDLDFKACQDYFTLFELSLSKCQIFGFLQ